MLDMTCLDDTSYQYFCQHAEDILRFFFRAYNKKIEYDAYKRKRFDQNTSCTPHVHPKYTPHHIHPTYTSSKEWIERSLNQINNLIRATEYFARLPNLNQVCVVCYIPCTPQVHPCTPQVHPGTPIYTQVHPCTPMYTPCTPNKVCKIAKSKVKPDLMFGRRNKVGYGLITTRQINKGEKFYTVMETEIDVEIVPKKRELAFKGFDYGTNEVITPIKRKDQRFETEILQQPETKPLIFFIQHDSVGNCEVRLIYTLSRP